MQLLSFEEFLAKFQEELDIGYWESGCQYESDMSHEHWYELNYRWYTSTGVEKFIGVSMSLARGSDTE